MLISLEVQSGPRNGERFQLVPGKTLRVGRTTKSEFVFAEDSLMSGVHFDLQCSERACELRDLGSRNGTFLNGQKVTRAALQKGDRIVAGGTVFLLQMETEQVAAVKAGPAVLGVATPQQRLLSVLRRDFQPLYAILDAARDSRVLALLLHSKEEHQSLYEGHDGAKLAQFAPYLVKLEKDSTLLDTLVHEGWAQSWGVYFTSSSEFADVRRHLRHFLEVKLPDGKQVYFRFYDPRVLRTYLPSCTPEETNQFFGPIKNYLIEGERPDQLIQFAHACQGLVTSMISVSSEATSATLRSTEAG